MAATSSIPTIEDYLNEARTRLDSLCNVPMSPVEFELWRTNAQLEAALRLLVERRSGDETAAGR